MFTHTPDTLLEAMRHPAFYPHPANPDIQVIHTHISSVFLTGEFAYKIKKPVNFGFLDFTQLADRKHFCEEELRLNRRLAPALYLGVVAIAYKNGTYRLHQANASDLPAADVVEYAVKMRQFDTQQQLDQLLKVGSLSLVHIDTLALQIAQFHRDSECAASETPWGTPASVLEPMLHNFVPLRQHLTDPALQDRLQTLEQWTQHTWQALQPVLIQRKHEGRIRACHGDMHLGNIAMIGGEITIFDGIEFNDSLRWIDTASEIAFLCMDLHSRNAPQYANRALNAYLEASGDYGLLAVFSFYCVYRALVRAKVNALRLPQQTVAEQRAESVKTCTAYLDLAQRYTQRTRPALIISHGLSGSGKSWGCRQLGDELGFIHLRSDVERKRLNAMSATERSTAGLDQGIYSPSMSARTYDRLAQCSALALDQGYCVVVDATFLDGAQRQRFQALAAAHDASFLILHFSASVEQLEHNIRTRQAANNDASDADIAVLHQQLAHYKPLQDNEPCVTVQSNQALPIATIQAHALLRSK